MSDFRETRKLVNDVYIRYCTRTLSMYTMYTIYTYWGNNNSRYTQVRLWQEHTKTM